MKPVYVPTDPHEKAMQRALIQYRDPKNYALVHEALEKAGRTDLIGYEKHCLIRPRKGETLPSVSAEKGKKTPVRTEKPSPRDKKTPAKQSGGKGQSGKPGGTQKKQQRGKTPVQTSGKPTPKPPTAAQLAAAERYLKKRKKK